MRLLRVEGLAKKYRARQVVKDLSLEVARGEVVGEVGLVFGERSANMDAATDARLLRFPPNTLQRLARQRPRIAATILRNLNEILAQRLSRSTVRLTS